MTGVDSDCGLRAGTGAATTLGREASETQSAVDQEPGADHQKRGAPPCTVVPVTPFPWGSLATRTKRAKAMSRVWIAVNTMDKSSGSQIQRGSSFYCCRSEVLRVLRKELSSHNST